LYNTQYFSESGYTDQKKIEKLDTIARYVHWESIHECKGIWRNQVCVFSIEDLPKIKEAKEFIVNKFLLDFDPIAYQCMEEFYYSKTKIGKLNSSKFMSYGSLNQNDTQFYCERIKQVSTLVRCNCSSNCFS
jgi:hypothetical protein